MSLTMGDFAIFTLLVVLGSSLSFGAEDGGGKRMVCYYGAWAVYRPGRGRFLVEDIDPNLCTHLVYGFAKLEENEIRSYDPWEDLKDGGGKGGFTRFSGLKKRNPKLKTLIAIGGWNEGSTKYSEMASDPSSRKTFVDSIIPFLKKYDFDGLDLDWEYPTTRGGKPEDKENFSLLVQELREALKGYLLTAAVSPNIETVPEAYEIPVLAEHLDFVSVMCYDYHGAWEGHPYTGHNTPLHPHPKDAPYNPHFNVEDTLRVWIQGGLPPSKINMGMALYGRGFTLDEPTQHGLYAPAKEGIRMGPYTRQNGTWGYNEICEVFKGEEDGWKIVIDPYIQAPYAYKDDLWIGYDDVESLYKKAVYARELGLGGAMVWSIETDDFRGYCHNRKYPLIHTIKKTMAGGPMPVIPQRPEVVESEQDNEILPPKERPTTTTEDFEFEESTTKKARPSRKPRPPKPTTPEDLEEVEEYSTTKKPGRPSRRPRPPRPTTPEEEEEEEEVLTTKRPKLTTPRMRTTTTTTASSEEQEEGGPPSSGDGECHSEGIMGNGGDCETFVICQHLGNGQYMKHVQSCAHGLSFDPAIKACNFPDQVKGCRRNWSGSFYRDHQGTIS